MWEFLNGIFEQARRAYKGVGIITGQQSLEYSVAEDGISRLSLTGNGKRYPWSDVQHVSIITTEDGPWFDDFFYVIKTSNGDICITSFQAEKIKLLKHFDQLSGFKWERVIEAVGSTSLASFECWDRSWVS